MLGMLPTPPPPPLTSGYIPAYAARIQTMKNVVVLQYLKTVYHNGSYSLLPGYLERENYKVLEFHRNNSSLLKSSPPCFKRRILNLRN